MMLVGVIACFVDVAMVVKMILLATVNMAMVDLEEG